MDDFRMNDITVGLVYTAITSGIGELTDSDDGGICVFGNVEVNISDECAPDLTIEEILCIISMKELAHSIYKRICDLDQDKQKEILNYINDNL